MAHEHPLPDDEGAPTRPTDVPPVPGPPPGLEEEEGPAGDPPINPAVMNPD